MLPDLPHYAANVPWAPLCHADAKRSQNGARSWPPAIARRLKVGLVWAEIGNWGDRKRSITLPCWRPRNGRPGRRLQPAKGKPSAEAAAPPAGNEIHRPHARIGFADTAALMSLLDSVIRSTPRWPTCRAWGGPHGCCAFSADGASTWSAATILVPDDAPVRQPTTDWLERSISLRRAAATATSIRMVVRTGSVLIPALSPRCVGVAAVDFGRFPRARSISSGRSAGGAPDIAARSARQSSRADGRPVVVRNRWLQRQHRHRAGGARRPDGYRWAGPPTARSRSTRTLFEDELRHRWDLTRFERGLQPVRPGVNPSFRWGASRINRVRAQANRRSATLPGQRQPAPLTMEAQSPDRQRTCARPNRGGAPATHCCRCRRRWRRLGGQSNAAQIRRRLARAGGLRQRSAHIRAADDQRVLPGFENSIWLGLFGPQRCRSRLAKLRSE